MEKSVIERIKMKIQSKPRLQQGAVSGSSFTEYYQVYLNGQWIADCNDYCEAETIANANTMRGSVNIEKRS